MIDFFTNPTIVVPGITWMIAQFLKFVAKAVKGDISVRYLYKSGNMPSVHTAVVTSLLITIGFVEGIQSTFFGVTLVFALIVVYDALNVRRAVGEQGGILERLLQMQKDRLIYDGKRVNTIKLIEVLGHTPLEVAAGVAIGSTASLLLLYSYWPTNVTTYMWNYSDSERHLTKIVLLVVTVGSLASYLYLKRHRLRKIPSAKALSSKIAYGLLIPALFGLVTVWSSEVGFELFKSKIWLIFTVGWMLTSLIVVLPKAVSRFARLRDDELKELKEEKRRKRKKRRKK